MYHGYSCCSCGGECSGMGSCESCNGALCFMCAESHGEKGNRKVYCPAHAPKGSEDHAVAVLRDAFSQSTEV